MAFGIDGEPLSTNGQVRMRLVAHDNGRPIWADTIDVGLASARSRFRREVAERGNVSGEKIDAALLEMLQPIVRI
jgi:hypothetical protein